MICNTRYTDLSFGLAFDMVRMDTENLGMRLPSWKEDVVVRIQMPDANSKMTAPYLYVESRFGRVPWKETMIELFSIEWTVVEIREGTINDIRKNDEIETGCKVQNNDNLKEKTNNKIDKDIINSITPEDVKEATAMYEFINGNCGGSQECKKRCLHECDNKNLKFKKMNGEKVRDDSINSLANLIMYLHWLGYDFF